MKTARLSSAFGLLVVIALVPNLVYAGIPPAAKDLITTLKEDTSKKITLKATAAKGKKLTYTVTQAPSHGSYTFNNKTVVNYKPTANYYGTDSFQYTVNDGEQTSAPATVSLNIKAVNDAPVGTPQKLVVKKGATATITLNALDVENDTLRYQISTKPKVGNAIGKPVGNVVAYTPRKATYDKKGKLKKPDFTGADKFVFKVKDNGKPAKTSKVVKVQLTVSDNCPTGQVFKKGVCVDLPPLPRVCQSPQVPKNNECVNPVTSCVEPEKLQNNICVTLEANPQLTIINIGQGTVTDVSGEINCGENCSAVFSSGAKIQLNAANTENYGFVSWGGNCIGTSLDCNFQLYASTVVTATFLPRFNDTGITACADSSNNNLSCPQAAFPGQDGDSGRDKAYNDDSNGHAGFNFVKLDDNGNETTASQWACVKDKVTGLTWEVKTNDNGLHDLDWTYSWYEPDATKNGGDAGLQTNNSICSGSVCNTNAYVQAVNAASWCGHNDWRLPTREELLTIVDLGSQRPAIDTSYFPNTNSIWYWTSSPTANSQGKAWSIGFTLGDSPANAKSNLNLVRLVRSGK